ncbi:hypothetical protein BDZ94DRAFT_1326217 [Collybia nuda]|uniref:Uncharacterized protein n=1 Tax=Collybia nuda TaxID=64659 RepID=A0A9P5XXH6_9AGAR|nr:hypothetical protein BDZ94DRAFT_1326217 [Collybia nuda]
MPIPSLSSELAYQKTIRSYFLVGMLGILVWDILAHLSADYKLLVKFRFNIPTLIYHISRWTSLLYTVSSAIFETAQVENCKIFARLTCVAYHPAASATALLFFFRIRALYNGNKYITAVFVIMWLAIVGTSVTIITSLTGEHIDNTKYCTFVGLKSYGSSSNIVIAVFNTCIFIATTWRLLARAPPIDDVNTAGAGKFGLCGRYVPRFSRALLQDGQNYYMVAMICNLLVLIMTYAPGIPALLRPFFLVPSVGLTNMMACRVFRNTKLGHYDETNTTGTVNIMFRQSGPTTSIPIHSQRTWSTIYSIGDRDLHTSNVDDLDVHPPIEKPSEKLTQPSKNVSVV